MYLEGIFRFLLAVVFDNAGAYFPGLIPSSTTTFLVLMLCADNMSSVSCDGSEFGEFRLYL